MKACYRYAYSMRGSWEREREWVRELLTSTTNTANSTNTYVNLLARIRPLSTISQLHNRRCALPSLEWSTQAYAFGAMTEVKFIGGLQQSSVRHGDSGKAKNIPTERDDMVTPALWKPRERPTVHRCTSRWLPVSYVRRLVRNWRTKWRTIICEQQTHRGWCSWGRRKRRRQRIFGEINSCTLCVNERFEGGDRRSRSRHISFRRQHPPKRQILTEGKESVGRRTFDFTVDGSHCKAAGWGWTVNRWIVTDISGMLTNDGGRVVCIRSATSGDRN